MLAYYAVYKDDNGQKGEVVSCMKVSRDKYLGSELKLNRSHASRVNLKSHA